MFNNLSYDLFEFIADLVESQMLQFFHKASSIVLANITADIFNGLNEVEVNILLAPG